MKSAIRVARPPARPVMIYDGDCRFCGLWIRRWQSATGDRVEYLPFQDPRVAAEFPEIPREQFQTAVHLVQPDGSVCNAAEAVFRSLALSPHGQWLLDGYEHSPSFAGIAEACYRFVARHRKVFSFLTGLLWGGHVEPQSSVLVRRAFLRTLALIYLVAFVSLWTQIIGLVGHNGILPAQTTISGLDQRLTAMGVGLDRYHALPTLCWFNTSDAFLKFQCAAGATLAVLLLLGIAPAPCLFLLWLIYLSLTAVCDVFLGFQWDALLLETGFLAIFFAPLQLLPRRAAAEAPPSRVVLWLLRWLLFRLMFESGCVKLTWGDPAWHNLTALNFHYETQPLPTWIGWYAHQLPEWIQKLSTGLMFGIELGIPFLIFLPRRPRQFAAGAFCALQLVILLTGNYCFFNLLTIALCLTLLDDTALKACGRWARTFARRLALVLSRQRKPLTPDPSHLTPNPSPLTPLPRRRVWPIAVILPLLAIVLCTSYVQLLETFRVRLPGPEPVILFERWLGPLRTFNSYGLFRVMTTSRPEIIVEGSNDGVTWEPYEFKYKAGDLKQRPRFVAPHQPRLDWQMWFTALGDRNPWFLNFCLRLLQGSPPVLGLLEHNPFPDTPPRYLRAVLYEYHFTDTATRRRTGEWWRRELKGMYLPPIRLEGDRLERAF